VEKELRTAEKKLREARKELREARKGTREARKEIREPGKEIRRKAGKPREAVEESGETGVDAWRGDGSTAVNVECAATAALGRSHEFRG
jgi:vacuolar-type H+-ATPase subunit H